MSWRFWRGSFALRSTNRLTLSSIDSSSQVNNSSSFGHADGEAVEEAAEEVVEEVVEDALVTEEEVRRVL